MVAYFTLQKQINSHSNVTMAIRLKSQYHDLLVQKILALLSFPFYIQFITAVKNEAKFSSGQGHKADR